MRIDELKHEQLMERQPEIANRLQSAVKLLGLTVDVDGDTRVSVEDQYWSDGSMYHIEIEQVGANFQWRVAYSKYGKKIGYGIATIADLNNRTELRDSLIVAANLAKEQAQTVNPA